MRNIDVNDFALKYVYDDVVISNIKYLLGRFFRMFDLSKRKCDAIKICIMFLFFWSQLRALCAGWRRIRPGWTIEWVRVLKYTLIMLCDIITILVGIWDTYNSNVNNDFIYDKLLLTVCIASVQYVWSLLWISG